MTESIDKFTVRDLVQNGAALVDVLPAKGYEKSHLSGAINIPLTKLDEKSTSNLRKDQPIIVYCYDYQ